MTSLDDDNLPEDLLSNIFKKLRINNPAHSRDLARLSQTNKKMKDAVRSRYPIYDPIEFHTILNNPLLTRIARRYQLRFSEPLFQSSRGIHKLGRQYKASITNRRMHRNLKRKIDTPIIFMGDNPEDPLGGLWTRVPKSNQEFTQFANDHGQIFGQDYYEVEQIDLGRGY
eukprot:SAG11_NODE_228_length_11986_cov_128.901153_12_plen_170_part_00